MFRIVTAIVHEVPKGRYDAGTGIKISTSSVEAELAPRTQRFIEENMLNFALKAPRDILEDPASTSNTPAIVRDMLNDTATNFIQGSKDLAQRLHESQTGNSPSGVLIVAVVESDGSEPAVAIIKAEHQEGVRLKRVGGTEEGHFDLQHLDDLIVGNNSRVYKIAVLRLLHARLIGQMVDQQNGVSFADFFMSSFLGCRLADNAEIQTRQFVDSTFKFVNSHISDHEKQGRYAGALISYIQSPTETLHADEFAQRFLDPADRDSYLASMPEAVSSSVFAKNLSLVPGHGSGLRLYGSGISITASAAALERGAIQVLSEGGETVIRVAGPLKRFGLGTAPTG